MANKLERKAGMKRKSGAVILMLSYIIIAVLLIIAGVFIVRAINDKNIAYRYKESQEALNLAEAGINRTLKELRQDYNWAGIAAVNLGKGQYSVTIEAVGDKRQILSTGFIPQAVSFRSKRAIEVVARKYIPPNFFDNAIYSAGEVDLNGNAYAVNGNVLYAETIDNTDNVTGTITHDPAINPLAKLDFQQLFTISQGQGNVYDEARLDDVKHGRDSFPVSFWYSPPTDPLDPTTGIPNVVYVEEDLVLNGNIGTIGGFYVVAGDVITNPFDITDTTINGNGQIDGLIYTRGEFEVNGGGGGLNVNGGVWAGTEAELNGNATVSYNKPYMDAVKALNINPDVQILSWREK